MANYQVVVDEKLTGAGKFPQGAILSESGSPLASSSGLTMSSEEGSAIVAMISGTKSDTISVGGTSYPVLDVDSKHIHAKSGSSGVIVSTTGKIYIVGVYGEGQNPGSLAPVIKTVVAKLSEKGF